MVDPKDTRMIQTRDGVAEIPRSEKGVPLREFLRNTEFPENLERAVIYNTPSGPVAADPDPVPWTQQHNETVNEYAESLRDQIDEKGYYRRSLEYFADRLSRETGYPQSEMKAAIVSSFDAANGVGPFEYLQQVRAEQGLPVRQQEGQQGQAQEQEQ